MIINRINEWAKIAPLRTAIIWNDIKLSYLVLAQAVELTRGFYLQQNLTPGQTAVLLVGNIRDCWLCLLGLRLAGLNTLCVKTLSEAEHLNLDNIACLAITEAEYPDFKLPPALAGTKVISMPNSLFAGLRKTALPTEPHDPQKFGGHILFTSGTTGTYKKVLFDGQHDDARNQAQAKFRGFTRNTLYHGLHFPISSGIGFKCPAAVWHTGGTLVLDQRTTSFQDFFKYKLSYACIVPPALRDLIKLHQSSAAPQGDFEIMVGGGHLSLELAQQAQEKLSSRISNCFASTELSTPIMRTDFNTKDDLHWLSVDPDATVQIIDENGVECEPDCEGELRITLREFDPTFYLGDPEATAKVFRNGFFYPGDRAVRRKDGRIRILGRTTDVLTLGGVKSAVGPIEQKVQEMLKVEEVCLFSQFTENGQEELAICIQTEHEISQSTLKSVVKKFGPTELVRIVVMKEFPRMDSGMRKVRRAELKKLVFSEAYNDCRI
jgi:acyl-coenzyme A synthetase/AMP-(fatty) acid ligase